MLAAVEENTRAAAEMGKGKRKRNVVNYSDENSQRAPRCVSDAPAAPAEADKHAADMDEDTHAADAGAADNGRNETSTQAPMPQGGDARGGRSDDREEDKDPPHPDVSIGFDKHKQAALGFGDGDRKDFLKHLVNFGIHRVAWGACHHAPTLF